ncbi:MAG: carbon-nitrogen hydrolase family protein [Zoogloeaceae bacterium]|jgi:nitrilase|nr:carbon-nitrogen hydrolase family protein [Zoogloeaceae bacterium]
MSDSIPPDSAALKSAPAPRNARLASIQMVSGTDVARNLALAAKLIAEAADAGAEIIGLPEYFPLLGQQDSDLIRAGESFGRGPIQDWLKEIASRHRVWLLAGSIPVLPEADDGKSGKRICNTMLALDPDGAVRARYDKIHLFSFTGVRERYEEARVIYPGKVAPVTLETPFGRIGLSICYDLRFPELFRAMSREKPVDLIFLPAAFTVTTGRAHWEILTSARAIENQCYLLASCQGGTHENGRRTHGYSQIIDPWGEIIAQKKRGEGVILAELDHERIRQIRQTLPALTHRRLA